MPHTRRHFISDFRGKLVTVVCGFRLGGAVRLTRIFLRKYLHHFADYNWDARFGCPSFVSEKPGDGLQRVPEAMADTHRYTLNIAAWLSGALRTQQETTHGGVLMDGNA